MRDAVPGATLNYRMVDLGRARDYVYQAAGEPEIMAVGDMSYDALRVARTSSDGDQTVLWVASGVPTPIRILQRNADAVLVEAELLPGDLVVTEGVQSLRPGAEVQVQPGPRS